MEEKDFSNTSGIPSELKEKIHSNFLKFIAIYGGDLGNAATQNPPLCIAVPELVNVEVIDEVDDRDYTYGLIRMPRREKVKLTTRQTECARLAAYGLSSKDIAKILNISAFTVSEHLRRVYRKLKIDNRTLLAHYILMMN